MANKRALVTGGSRGIGRAISIMLAKNGFDVLINYNHNQDAAEETKREVEKHHVQGKLLQFDVSQFEQTKQIIEDEISNNGNIDVLILNAGVRKDVLFPLMNESEWNTVVDVNYKSFYYIVRPIINGMFRQKYGRIVVISSTAGLTGMPGQVNYSSTKFGIIGAAKSLAVEVARKNINVNIIAPGFIDTEMTKDIKDKEKEIIKTIPARKIGSTQDIANAVEFFISEKSHYITGQVLAVNGGIFT